MRTHRLWGKRSTRLAALLAAVVVTPAVTLVWLGLQLLAQDRELMAQRDVDRREAAAQAAARSFERSIATADQQAPLGTGLVRFTFEREGLKAEPPNRVWWVPVPPSSVTWRRASSPQPRRSIPGRGRRRQGGLHRPGSFAHRGIPGWRAPATRAGRLARPSLERRARRLSTSGRVRRHRHRGCPR